MLTHLCLALAIGLLARPQASNYPVFETDFIKPAELKAHRDSLKAEMGPNSLAVFFTNPERNRSNDTDFRFHPDPNFWYLTGFSEPDSALLLAPSGIEWQGKKVTEVLFVNMPNPMSVTWLGYRMGPANAISLLGVELALPNDRLNFGNVLKAINLAPSSTVFEAMTPEGPTGAVVTMQKQWSDWVASAGKQPVGRRLGQALAKMRVRKSPDELVLLKHACAASALGHREAMKSIEPGMREYEIQAVVEYVFMKLGCEFVGYPSIVGSGPNSTILHYEADRRLMKSGDMLCMDVAGEYHGYSADVTRSFPVNGKFSREQKAIYEIVLAAQDAGIAECQVGRAFGAPHQAAQKVITAGLMKLGIIASPNEVGRYFMHGTSHYIGLDVHDAHGDGTLQENYTLTVEPGIYIKEGSPCDKKWWNIGVRIEDDILVTKSGPVNMSIAAPRKVDEIEALMRQQGIGNLAVGK